MATLKLGSTGPEVSELQAALTAAGFPVPVTGDFQADTDKAVRAYQAAKGLVVDGLVGPATKASLGMGATVPGAANSTGPAINVATDMSNAPNEAGPNRLFNVRDIESKTTNGFRWALLEMAARLRTDPNYIAAVMASETGGTFSPSIKNPMGGATGLIQFMPATAKALGTSTDALAMMNGEDQLKYVEKYFKSHTGKMKSPTDVYMATFLPAFVGKPNSFILGRKGDMTNLSPGLSFDKVYTFNAGFDKDKDGIITVGDVGGTVEGILAKARALPPIVVQPEAPSIVAKAIVGSTVSGIGFGILAALGYWLWKASGR